MDTTIPIGAARSSARVRQLFSRFFAHPANGRALKLSAFLKLDAKMIRSN